MTDINTLIVEHQHLSYDALSEKIKEVTGKTVKPDAVRKRYVSLGLTPKKVNAQNQSAVLPPAQRVERDLIVEKLKDDKKDSDEKYRALFSRIRELEAEKEAALKIASTGDTFTIKPHQAKDGSETTVFVVASDWHLEERVKMGEVNDLNKYDLPTAKERAEKFFQIALHLTNLEAKNTPIRTMVLALLGDFFTGRLHEENLETCQLAPIDAAIEAKSWISSGIDFLLANSQLDLVIPCHVGNHSRITKKVHKATEMGNSLETFVYKALAKEYENNKRVKFLISESYHSYLRVYDMTIRFHHGHEINYSGGVGGLTIPVNKKIAQWNKSRWADLDVFGHWHSFFDGGNFIVNGSMIGFNAYALRSGFSFEQPKQAFFAINKRWKEKILVRPILFT